MTDPDPTDWALAEVHIEIVEDRTAGSRSDEGFVRVRRLELRNRYPDGHASAAYRYDVAERAAIDAAAIVLYHEGPDGLEVCLRSALRPPLLLRDGYRLPLPHDGQVSLWEVPAGLIEPDEEGEAGVRACAARETLEETGFSLAPDDFTRLGPPVYLTPGLIAERVHFMVAKVERDARGVPTEDGSPVEERAVVRFVPLEAALAAVDAGHVVDAKTEVALHRLAAARRRP